YSIFRLKEERENLLTGDDLREQLERPEKIFFCCHCEEVDTTDVAISNRLIYMKARLRSISRAKTEIASLRSQ
ncbi:MAG: hypothetical protein AABY50_06915, partial [Nitrospirota bacterium]